MLRRGYRWMRAGLFAVMLLETSGCGGSRPVATSSSVGGRSAHQFDPDAPLQIAAASDLQQALPKLADRFRGASGITTSITFGASGQLAEQIRQGAPFDIFLSANESFVQGLASAGLIKPESVHPYARGTLVLAVYPEMAAKVRSVSDLTKPEVKKIALANPATAPYGKAGKQALERAGLWDELRPKIVVAESVRQALLYAQKGDAEAALVGRAIAGVPEIRPFEVDPKLYDPIIQALGVVSASARTGDAERFARFIEETEGQSVLKEFGFAPPPFGRGSPESAGSAHTRQKPGSPRPQ